MEVIVKAGGIDQESVDAMVLMLYEGDAAPQGATAMIDKALDGAVTALRQEGEFTGKPKQQSILHTQGRLKAKKVILIGLGKPTQLTLEGLRQAAGSAVHYARGLGASTLAAPLGATNLHGIEFPRQHVAGIDRLAGLRRRLRLLRPCGRCSQSRGHDDDRKARAFAESSFRHVDQFR